MTLPKSVGRAVWLSSGHAAFIFGGLVGKVIDVMVLRVEN
jgi:hypothetical protein